MVGDKWLAATEVSHCFEQREREIRKRSSFCGVLDGLPCPSRSLGPGNSPEGDRLHRTLHLAVRRGRFLEARLLQRLLPMRGFKRLEASRFLCMETA